MPNHARPLNHHRHRHHYQHDHHPPLIKLYTGCTRLNVTNPPPPPPRHSNPLWPLHVWLRKTISSDIIDVTDVIVIKLLACEGPLCHRAVWWIIVKVIACWCFMEGLYVNAQVSASRVGWPARLTHKRSGWRFLISREKKWRWGHFFDNTTLPFLFTFKFSFPGAYGCQKTSEINSRQFWT